MLTTVDIKVSTQYLGQQIQNDTPVFVFSYTVDIANNGSSSITLRNRTWLITNGDGEEVEVSGEGVIGEQPLIEPNQTFQYTSASVLKTPVGTMEGNYEFELSDGSFAKAEIPMFSLTLPNTLH